MSVKLSSNMALTGSNLYIFKSVKLSSNCCICQLRPIFTQGTSGNNWFDRTCTDNISTQTNPVVKVK